MGNYTCRFWNNVRWALELTIGDYVTGVRFPGGWQIKNTDTMRRQKNKQRDKRFPFWIEIVRVMLTIGVMAYTISLLQNGDLGKFGLLIGMVAVWLISEIYRIFEVNNMEMLYEDELEELDIEKNMISNENRELKRRLSRKRVKKTKEDND